MLAATTAVVLGWEGARANTPQDFFYHLFFWLFIGVVGLLVWSAMKAMGRWDLRLALGRRELRLSLGTGPLRLALGAVVAVAVVLALVGAASESPSISIPAFGKDIRPDALDNKIDDAVEWLNRTDFRDFLHDDMTRALLKVLVPLEKRLLEIPWWLFIGVVGLLAWRVSGHKVALVSVGSLLFLVVFQIWDQAMRTVAVVGTATFMSTIIAVLVGIAMAKSDRLQGILRPILDGMQTMPSFVYLIPTIYFIGLGKVPAVLATMVYAMPPAMRLTNLGIRLVPPELKEAARAFGTTPWQMLLKVEIPLARPTIMAGVNQTIMMALAMVVVASLVGAQGLGADILNGINNLELGKGLMAGLGIVALAIVIDRISQGFARGAQSQNMP